MLLASVVIWLGAYFGANFGTDEKMSVNYKLICHFLLLVNSGIIYFLAKTWLEESKVPLLISIAYLLIPSHLTVFLFEYQIQFLLAEMFVLASFLLFIKNKDNEAFVVMAIAILLNPKLMALYAFYLCFRKSSIIQRMFIFSHVLVNVIIFEPLYRQYGQDLIFNPGSVFYSIEDLVAPISKTILDMSMAIPSYYDRVFLIALTASFVLLSFYVLSKKNFNGKLISAFLLTSFIGTFIPVKYFFTSFDVSTYNNIAAYPLIPFIALLILLKTAQEKKSGLVIVVAFMSMWAIKDIRFQQSTQNVVNHWNEVIYSMPASFNNEEKIKLVYTNMLILNREFDSAERFVNINRFKFPNETWYNIARSLALRRQDENALKRLEEDLYQYKIPFHID